jgi:Tol biopolymer transport system component
MKKFFVIALATFLSFQLFAQEDEAIEKNFLKNTRQLIYEGKRSGEGYFSQDGRYMIFQSEREADNPFYQIYILDFETGDVKRVSPGHGKTTCSFFQWGDDGDRILFASSHLDPDVLKEEKEEFKMREEGKAKRYKWDYEPYMDIFTTNRDGSDIKQLTTAMGYDAEGAYSPDGKLIVFASNRRLYANDLTDAEKEKAEVDPSYFCDLYIMNSDGSDMHLLTDAPGYDGGPFFTPDGKRVVWRRFSEDGHSADVYTMNIDGTDEKRITEFEALSWAPYFHPSNEYILFATNKQGYANFEIYMVDAEGLKEPVRVTYTDGFDGLPVFMPDGKKMVWTSTRTTNKEAQLFIADWDHEYALEALKNAPLREKNGKLNYHFLPEIKTEELEEKLTYIASDELEGRMTGSEGAKKAADYISNIFSDLDLQPLAENEDYLFPFDFVSDYKVIEDDNEFSMDGKPLKLNTDYIPLSSSDNGEVESEVVFAGYGLKVDGKDKFHYNSYSDVEVKDKIVMVLEGIPEGLDKEKQELFERNISGGYKQMLARQLGAKAILIITKEINNERSKEMVGSAGIISLNISESLANNLLAEKEQTVEEAKKNLESGDPKANEHLFALNTKVKIKTKLERVVKQDNNIVGAIYSEDNEAPYIFIGGHYDHLGFGEVNSRSDEEHKHDICNGADDNGSGTVTVLELAEYFAGLKKDNPEAITANLVFCLWSGEELGLLGSAAFTSDLPVPADKIKAYVNFDMVGRVKDNKLEIQGVASATEWKKIFEKKNIVTGFNLSMTDDPYLPTDVTSFYLQKIPVISFFSGIHMDYHTYKDDVELINFGDLQRGTKLASLVIKEMMKPEQTITYQKVKIRRAKGTKGAYSVTLGTIPVYSGGDGTGMGIQGTRDGGPAAKAGILGGDVIVSLAGKDVKNIYDFMNIMNEMKPNVEYDLSVRRNGEIVKLKITPEAKK